MSSWWDVVVEVIDGDGGHLDRLLRPVGESLNPDVQRVAQTYFKPENRLVVTLLPGGAQ